MKKIISFITMVAIIVCLLPITSKAAVTTQNLTVNRYYDKAFKVVTLVNQERAKYGLNPLTMDSDLYDAAMLRAAEALILFAHERPDGTMCYTSSSKMYGENIAQGYNMVTTAEEVVTGWMNSPGHRANILKADYTSIGVGAVSWNNYNSWSQAFGYNQGASFAQPKNGAYTYTIKVDENYVKNNGGNLDIKDATPAAPTPAKPTKQDILNKAKDFLNKNYAIRMYDPNRKEHVFSAGENEVELLINAGWIHETTDLISFKISKTKTEIYDTPVYRLYNNKFNGAHMFTINVAEREKLLKEGWRPEGNEEGIVFYVSTNKNDNKVYRLKNPNNKAGERHWTTSDVEYKFLLKQGWIDETNDTLSWYSPAN